jgi:hypothetical protein
MSKQNKSSLVRTIDININAGVSNGRPNPISIPVEVHDHLRLGTVGENMFRAANIEKGNPLAGMRRQVAGNTQADQTFAPDGIVQATAPKGNRLD